jgi:hypothetical protein
MPILPKNPTGLGPLAASSILRIALMIAALGLADVFKIDKAIEGLKAITNPNHALTSYQ